MEETSSVKNYLPSILTHLLKEDTRLTCMYLRVQHCMKRYTFLLEHLTPEEGAWYINWTSIKYHKPMHRTIFTVASKVNILTKFSYNIKYLDQTWRKTADFFFGGVVVGVGSGGWVSWEKKGTTYRENCRYHRQLIPSTHPINHFASRVVI